MNRRPCTCSDYATAGVYIVERVLAGIAWCACVAFEKTDDVVHHLRLWRIRRHQNNAVERNLRDLRRRERLDPHDAEILNAKGDDAQ